MYLQMKNILVLGMILGLTIALDDCGGESPTKGSGSKDGRILVRNETAAIFDLSYVDPAGTLVEAVVDPGQTKEVSEVLKGGTKITLKLASRTCPDSPGFIGHRAYGEAKVTIDGNVTVRILPPVALNIPVTAEVM